MASNLAPPTTTTFRDLSDAISPTWLQGPNGQRLRYVMAVEYDALADGASYAGRSRFPTVAPADALQYLAQDRQIVRGPNETTDQFTARLQQWLDLWRHAGSDLGVMLAILSYVTPATPQVAMVCSAGDGSSSRWNVYAAGATPFPGGQTNPTPPETITVSPANWDWDSNDPPYYAPWMWWRSWAIIYSTSGSPWPAPTATWAPASGTITTSVVSDATLGTVYQGSGGSGTDPTEFDWDDGTSWDWAGSPSDAANLRALVAQWKSAGTWVPWICVVYDPTWFVPASTSPQPSGLFGFWGAVQGDATLGTVYGPGRVDSSTVSFIVGTADGASGEPQGAC